MTMGCLHDGSRWRGAVALALALGVLAAGAAAADVAAPIPPASAEIDHLVEQKCRAMNVQPAPLCSDEVFLRRVYLDVIGTLPDIEEANAFLADTSAAKRAGLIDRLLQRPEFADYWSLKWGDLLRIKSEFPVRLWPKAAQTYYRWVRQGLAENKPYDRFVAELLTSTGSNFRDGPCNFMRGVTNKDPQSLAQITALLFMGLRSSDSDANVPAGLSANDLQGLAAFFAQVRYKATGEWKEEIVYLDPAGVLRDANKQIVPPRFPGGQEANVPAGADARVVLAAWLTGSGNPYFARNIANRTWSWLMGRGLVEECDDFRPANPPSNPALLDHLAAEMVGSHYDHRHLFRIILNSRTYQAASEMPSPSSVADACFARYRPRRLGAEVLLDAMCKVTQTTQSYSSIIPEPYTKLADCRAINVSDGSIGSPFLELFGRPPRNSPVESERNSHLSLRQVLYLLNSGDVERMISTSPRLKRLAQAKVTDAEIVDELYRAAFGRPPGEPEKAAVLALMKDKPRAQALGDLTWAILNSGLFMMNR